MSRTSVLRHFFLDDLREFFLNSDLALRDREANNLLLRDENLAMRRKLEVLQQTQAALATAEVEADRLKERLKRWEEFERSDPEGSPTNSVFRSPEEVTMTSYDDCCDWMIDLCRSEHDVIR